MTSDSDKRLEAPEDANAEKKPSIGGTNVRQSSSVSLIAPKSSHSFTSRKTQSQAGTIDEESVTFTVTIAQAIPNAYDDTPQNRKKSADVPKVLGMFHLEYSLLPSDIDMGAKIDLVHYGSVVKMFTERQDPKTLKTWQDGSQTWVAWSNSHTIAVTSDILKQMFENKPEVRLWDSRDKIGSRAKSDRPKALKVSSKENLLENVKSMVLKQARHYENLQPKQSYIDRPLPPVPSIPVLVPEEIVDTNAKKTKKGIKADQSPSRDKSLIISPSKIEKKLSGQPVVPSTSNANPDTKPKKGKKSAPGSPESEMDSDTELKRDKRRERENQALAEHAKKFGRLVLPINMAHIFAGSLLTTERLDRPISECVTDMFVTISVDRPLLTEEQKEELNPLVMRVKRASDMPKEPLNFTELRTRCKPVYCKYNFLNLGERCTIGRPQSNDISWDDVYVILAGNLKYAELKEYFLGPPFTVEVHDRDRLDTNYRVPLPPTLFGDEPMDEKISNVGVVSGKRTLHNAFEDREKPWDPYGIAKFTLMELLLGQTRIELQSPIQPCPQIDTLGLQKNQGKIVGHPGAVDGPVDPPLPMGQYMESGTFLHIQVELAKPLVRVQDLLLKQPQPTTRECPFSRIIFKFPYKETYVLNQLQEKILRINANALELHDMPPHLLESALSTYKLSVEQQESRELDILTGFHVLDTNIHLFVLEGLRDLAVAELWRFINPSQYTNVKVLYHSNICFSRRLYGPLDVDICRIKLHQPLDSILQQPLLYIRDIVPQMCQNGLIKLSHLTQTEKLHDAMRNELFPSAEMIVSISREFGVPLTYEDFEELKAPPSSSSSLDNELVVTSWSNDMDRQWPMQRSQTLPVGTSLKSSNQSISTVRPSLKTHQTTDHTNEMYEKVLEERKTSNLQVDYNQQSKSNLSEMSERIRQYRQATAPTKVHVDSVTAYNYSSQALNSTELAKAAIRHILAEHSVNRRFTYSQEYLGATMIPIDPELEKKQEQEQSRKKWKTSAGFVYPGRRTFLQSNQHPKKPHPARVDDLTLPFMDNDVTGYNRNVLERDPYNWDERHRDMNTWSMSRDEDIFGPTPPSIDEAHNVRKEAIRQLKQKQLEEWKNHLVVKDPRPKFHRMLPATEMIDRGRKASNDLEKLKNVLKDSPHKYAIRFGYNNVPALSVVKNPSVDTETRSSGVVPLPAVDNEFKSWGNGFAPGDDPDVTLFAPKNRVKRVSYEHDKFAKVKGKDFDAQYKPHPLLYKRHIVPLTDNEYETHLFRERLPSKYQIPNTQDIAVAAGHTYWEQFADVEVPDVSLQQQQISQDLSEHAVKI